MIKRIYNPEEKQAYLIIAHKDDLVFNTLLKMLDHSKNDIFIHMDIKNNQYDEENVEDHIKNASLYHVERTSVTWGGESQINAELLLLEKATSIGKYQHYHLISGADLPIKTQEQIQSFFESNADKEFLRFENDRFEYADRVRYYHLLQDKVGRSHNIFLRGIEKVIVSLQKFFHIHRNKDIIFQKGTNWFSITDEFARYVVSMKPWIKETFKYTYCCDEVFMQTLIINSPFVNNLYHKEFDNSPYAIMRLIDWTRGKPYIFLVLDYDELCESEMMFARKFDSVVDKEIIKKIYNTFS